MLCGKVVMKVGRDAPVTTFVKCSGHLGDLGHTTSTSADDHAGSLMIRLDTVARQASVGERFARSHDTETRIAGDVAGLLGIDHRQFGRSFDFGSDLDREFTRVPTVDAGDA